MPEEKDFIESLFNELENSFDVEEPHPGHRERFLDKLQRRDVDTRSINRNRFWYWKLLSIAASLLLMLGLGLQLLQSPKVTKVSPEVEKTQFYFASLLNEEIEKLNNVATPDTKLMVEDAMKQLDKLQKDYELLELELKKSGDSKKILYAMMVNFQTRIDLLQEVINKIEETKRLKNLNNNTYEDISI